MCEIVTAGTDNDLEELAYTMSWQVDGVDFTDATDLVHQLDWIPAQA